MPWSGHMRWLRIGPLAALLCLHAVVATAQFAGGPASSDGSARGGYGRRGAGKPAGPTHAPDLPPLPEIWPRLDAGAVFCHSRDGLIARAEMPADAEPGALPEGCRLIQEPIGVAIVTRIPPGSTEVRLSSNGEVGWTDVYLPDKAPQRASTSQ